MFYKSPTPCLTQFHISNISKLAKISKNFIFKHLKIQFSFFSSYFRYENTILNICQCQKMLNSVFIRFEISQPHCTPKVINNHSLFIAWLNKKVNSRLKAYSTVEATRSSFAIPHLSPWSSVKLQNTVLLRNFDYFGYIPQRHQ